MEKKNQLQTSLEEWAEKTVKAYHEIALEVNLAYYTQSDLSKITESPEVAIVGINPGGGEKDTYEGQRKNKNWSYLYKNLHKNTQDKDHLLKGNYCQEGEEPSSWEKHKSWNYWSRLRHCLQKTYLKEFIDDDSKIIVTNASFFSTPTAKEIEEQLLENTIPYTLELMEITNPKNLIFLSGKKCFERLSRLPSLKFKYKHICGNIYIGNLNDRLCIGIPHPAYKTNEELNLVASVIPYLINVKRYEDVDVELINRECSKQIKDYSERVLNKISSMNPCHGSYKIDKTYIVNEIISKINLEAYEEKNNRYILKDKIGITITTKDKGCIQLRIKDNSKLPIEYINALKDKLQKKDYNINIDSWIGRKLFTKFGQNNEDIVNEVLKEIEDLKDFL